MKIFANVLDNLTSVYSGSLLRKTRIYSVNKKEEVSLRDKLYAIKFDTVLLFLTFFLLFISIIMVYSSTGVMSEEKYGTSFYYFKKHLFSIFLGVCLMSFLIFYDIDKLEKLSNKFFIFTLILLLLPILPGISDKAWGAERWINLGFIRFQPGEVAKPFFIIYLASYYARHEQNLKMYIHGIVKPLFLMAIIGGLYLLEPDFGSAFVMLLITIFMGFVAGTNLKHLLLTSSILVFPLSAIVYFSPYRLRRIISFLNPETDPTGTNYQLIQSLVAIGNGQITGRGIGEGQQKLFFLPAAHTDFIFALIGEELGFIGSVLVLLLFILFLWRGLKIAKNSNYNSFRSLLAVGMTLLIVLPALINVGVVTGRLPTKGLVLPFIGYGGSNLICCLAAVGILVSISKVSVKRI